MGRTPERERRLSDKLNSFEWREKRQIVVHLLPLWLAILAALAGFATPWVMDRIEKSHLTGTAVGGEE